MCRRPKKGRFFLRLGRFWTFCAFLPYRVPYGQTALREGPLRGGFFREGKLTRSYGEGFYQNWAEFPLLSVDQKNPIFLKAGPFLDLCLLRDLSPLQGPLGRPPYRKAPYGEASYGKAPYREASYGRHL